MTLHIFLKLFRSVVTLPIALNGQSLSGTHNDQIDPVATNFVLRQDTEVVLHQSPQYSTFKLFGTRIDSSRLSLQFSFPSFGVDGMFNEATTVTDAIDLFEADR